MPCRHMNCDSSRNVSRTTLNVEVNWFQNFLDFILATSKSIGRSLQFLVIQSPYTFLKKKKKKKKGKKRKDLRLQGNYPLGSALPNQFNNELPNDTFLIQLI